MKGAVPAPLSCSIEEGGWAPASSGGSLWRGIVTELLLAKNYVNKMITARESG